MVKALPSKGEDVGVVGEDVGVEGTLASGGLCWFVCFFFDK